MKRLEGIGHVVRIIREGQLRKYFRVNQEGIYYPLGKT
jgi:hypothetical protein